MATSISYAGYGVWNSTDNVTSSVQAAYGSGTRVFLAGNQWGGDPSPGNRKYLYIVWNHEGDAGSGVVGEGDSQGIVVP